MPSVRVRYWILVHVGGMMKQRPWASFFYQFVAPSIWLIAISQSWISLTWSKWTNQIAGCLRSIPASSWIPSWTRAEFVDNACMTWSISISWAQRKSNTEANFIFCLTQNSKAHRVAVGIGKKIHRSELEKIADSSNRVIKAENFEDLNKKLEAIREAVCNKG